MSIVHPSHLVSDCVEVELGICLHMDGREWTRETCHLRKSRLALMHCCCCREYSQSGTKSVLLLLLLFPLLLCLGYCCITGKKQHNQWNLENLRLGLAFSFRRLVHACPRVDHGGRQADRHGTGAVLRTSILAGDNRQREKERGWACCRLLKTQTPSPVAHLLQQGHTP